MPSALGLPRRLLRPRSRELGVRLPACSPLIPYQPVLCTARLLIPAPVRGSPVFSRCPVTLSGGCHSPRKGVIPRSGYRGCRAAGQPVSRGGGSRAAGGARVPEGLPGEGAPCFICPHLSLSPLPFHFPLSLWFFLLHCPSNALSPSLFLCLNLFYFLKKNGCTC